MPRRNTSYKAGYARNRPFTFPMKQVKETRDLLGDGTQEFGAQYQGIRDRARRRSTASRTDRNEVAELARFSHGPLLTMMTRLLQAIALLGLATLVTAQPVSRPTVPDAIKAPPAEQVVLLAHASGVQIYVCRESADGKPSWVLEAPEAQLRDEKGAIIGRHYAGPTWKHNDGSEVSGKAVAHIDSPDANAIPWLLVTAAGHSGHGALSRVTSIQRIHTQGGQPPSASQCSSATLGQRTQSSYTADYYFYEPAK